MSDSAAIMEMLKSQLDRLFADRVDRTTLRASEDGAWAASLWDECESLGLPLLLVPEKGGGVGIGWMGAFVLFKLLGRHVVPLPIGETVIAASLLARAGIPVPPGPLTFCEGKSDVIAAVPWARHVNQLVVLRPGKVELVALSSSAVSPGANIGRDPRDGVDLAAGDVIASGTLAGAGTDLAMRLGAMLRASQIAGALSSISAMTIEYANLRVQFGKPIGKFQAVQQSLAVLACEAAAADVAAAMAAQALDEGRDGAFEVAVAKIRAGEAAGAGAALSHQAHGAIGFTDEHRLHDFTRRLWSWRSEFGSERYWANRLGRIAAAAGVDVWGAITAPAEASHG